MTSPDRDTSQLSALELLQDSDSSQETIGPHWASSFPEYLSTDWDKDEQCRVVWSRLQNIRTLANQKPSKTTERYHALRQEYQKTQVDSSREPLFRDNITGGINQNVKLHALRIEPMTISCTPKKKYACFHIDMK